MPSASRSKDYFEAILQIRPKNKEVLDFIKKQVEKRENDWIAKQEELKYGVDLYISTRKFAIVLGRKLKKSFDGELKVSKKLFKVSRQTSKKVYRVTVLFRVKTKVL